VHMLIYSRHYGRKQKHTDYPKLEDVAQRWQTSNHRLIDGLKFKAMSHSYPAKNALFLALLGHAF